MKPTVIANASTGGNPGSAHAAANASSSSSNGINIPINHEYANQQHHQQSPFHTQYADANAAYGSPNAARQQQQQQHPQQQQQPHHQSPQIPAHFQQGFGFEPDMDMDMDMFPRTRLGRMHDPFAGFGGTRKRSSVHDPHSIATDGFSRYFDDDADFGFPQFGSMGRRRAGAGADQHPAMTDEHDFFNRLPSEFRQYIPETFGHRRAGSGSMPQQQQHQPVHPQQHAQQQQPHQQQQQAYPQQQAPVQGQYYQNYVQPGTTPPNGVPLSPSKTLCDAAIQTEDPMGPADEVDHVGPMQKDSLSQHGLRNTVDMGVKSMAENEMHGPRSHSAPPPEQQQQQQQHQIPVNGQRATQPPPPQQQHGGQHPQFGTQTSPQVQQQQTGAFGQQPPQFQKAYYAPHQQSHPQQKQNTPPPPQTPGGTYIRTIPIFVEGRSEPIINSHKEIPNQNGTSGAPTASASASARAFTPQQQQQYYQQQQQQPPQQHRPTPLNTQQQQQEQQTPAAAGPGGLPPQTPHTLDSISKIQDIQRDVLDLMGKVENFGGRYLDKEYAYLDEMLTRNLLKLDTIDTNGKDSIRLARKEAIKCIQASINVLEAKAEENAKTAQGGAGAAGSDEAAASPPPNDEAQAEETKESTEAEEPNAKGATSTADEPADATKIQEPIPLPAPEGMQVDEQANSEEPQKEASPAPAAAEQQSTTATESQTTVESK